MFRAKILLRLFAIRRLATLSNLHQQKFITLNQLIMVVLFRSLRRGPRFNSLRPGLHHVNRHRVGNQMLSGGFWAASSWLELSESDF